MIVNSEFKPAAGLENNHIQTLFSAFFRRKLHHDYIPWTLELEDGDFLDLLWTSEPEIAPETTLETTLETTAEKQAPQPSSRYRPIVIVFHGLQGGISSPYVGGIMRAIEKQGWTGLLMHFRGCSGRMNRLARSYHSGDTGDAKALLRYLCEQYPGAAMAAVGYSMGGNMLLKLQAELGEASIFKAVVSVCAPLELNNCALRINQGLSKIYQHHLLTSLKKNAAIKAQKHNYHQLISLSQKKIKYLNSFREFDNAVTAPLHGFRDVDDYYAQSSARQYLHAIHKPTLIIQARDDPFMSCELLPDASELSSSTQLELSKHGGHVGFVSGHLLKPVFWLETRIPQYLSQFI